VGLGPLTASGLTNVYPLVPPSPAIDTATGDCPRLDQRGFGRPVGVQCDLGAYEFLAVMAGAGAGPTATPGRSEILPTNTPTPTPAPAGPSTVTFKVNGNCRKGPGIVYNIVTSLAQGQQAQVDGRDAQSQWVDVLVPNTQARCWVALSSVDLNVPVETLALLPLPPLPDAPATFTDKAQCVIKSKSLTVKLTWLDVSNESGYHIYRNGNLIDTAGANVTTYMDGSAPLGVDLTYEIEAFNANGASGRVQTTVSACK
jgi:hypothetical protein